ncbi:MAG TPA: hypothetical protein VF707_08925 [Ardenticatenaceae bacterium]|jgi:hypothetical protein
MKQRWFAVIILAMMLLLAACGGTAQPETDQAETDTNTPAAAATNTTAPAPTEAEEPTEEPEEEPTEEPEEEPTEEPEEEPTEEPEEEPTEEPEEEPTEEADTGDEGDDTTSEGQSLFAVVDDIDTFRLRTTVTTEGEAFEEGEAANLTSFSMEGEFVREPPAQRLSISTPEGADDESMLGGLGNFEMIQIGDTGYMNLGTGWTEMPGGDLMSGFAEFTFIDPESMNISLDEMERVGEEEVNGRNTVHLRGGEEFVTAMNEDDETFSMENLEEAQVDLWVDEEDNFIVRMQMVAEGTGVNEENPDATGRIEILIEYYDFNEDITIEAPEVASLGDMLGLDIELPEGTEMGFSSDGFATVTIPLTMDETAAFIEEAMADNGFELDVDASFPDMGTYTFTAEGRTVNVILAEDGDSTSVTITVTEE